MTITTDQVKKLRGHLVQGVSLGICEGFEPEIPDDLIEAYDKLNKAGWLVTSCDVVDDKIGMYFDDFLHDHGITT